MQRSMHFSPFWYTGIPDFCCLFYRYTKFGSRFLPLVIVAIGPIVVLVDNNYVGAAFLKTHQPLVDVMVSRCPSSDFSCHSTCSGWVVGVNAHTYSVAFFFVFLMHDHVGYVSHHLDSCTSKRRIHSHFDSAVVLSSWIGPSFPWRTQLMRQRWCTCI